MILREALCTAPEMCHSIMKEKERTWERRGEKRRGERNEFAERISIFSSLSFLLLPSSPPPSSSFFSPAAPTEWSLPHSFPLCKSLPHRNPNLQIEFLSSRLDSTPLHSERKWSISQSALPLPSFHLDLPSLSAPSVLCPRCEFSQQLRSSLPFN